MDCGTSPPITNGSPGIPTTTTFTGTVPTAVMMAMHSLGLLQVLVRQMQPGTDHQNAEVCTHSVFAFTHLVLLHMLIIMLFVRAHMPSGNLSQRVVNWRECVCALP